MSEISLYLLSIVGLAFLLVIVDLILPVGKISNYVKGISAFLLMVVVLSPIIKIINNSSGIFSWIKSTQYKVDYNLLQTINDTNNEEIERELEIYLANNGYENTEVSISYKTSVNEIKMNYIFVNLSKLVINKNVEHIDYYTKIKELIKKRISIEEDNIIIYG